MREIFSNQNTAPVLDSKRYMPGLDGLRALSILAVIAYHLNFPWASGGFLGVGIFFTLSGYLITDQLLMEWNKTGKISLKGFWIRRVRRIIPAMLLLLATVFLCMVFLAPSRIEALKGDFISTLLYYNNWWKIFHNVSYFESFGPQSPIGHLWSLAIEEQFYILWPVILMAGLRFTTKRRNLAALVTIGAIASILAMELVYVPGADPSRVYYGTDTRAFALLAGAAFAIVCPSCKLSEHISLRRGIVIDILGVLGILGILLMIWRTNEYQTALYAEGLAVLSVVSAVVTVILAHPGSRVAKLMGCKPLKWIGVRSYSLYLWHYPVIILTTPSVDTGELDLRRVALQLALSFLLADFSWKYIETPIRRMEFTQLRSKAPILISSIAGKSLLFIIIAISSFYFSSSSTALKVADNSYITICAAAKQIQTDNPAAASSFFPLIVSDSGFAFDNFIQHAKEDKKNAEMSSENQEQTSQPTDDPGNVPVEENVPDKQTGNEQNPSADLPAKKSGTGEGVLVIGDSIIINAVPYLEELLPGIIVDGKVSRQMSQAQDVLDQYRPEGKFNRIVIELGTNGPFNPKQLRQLMASLGDMKQVILVNTRIPRNWQEIVNSDLASIASEYSNATLADWFSASKGKDSFFYDDGVHLKPEGASSLAAVIASAVKS